MLASANKRPSWTKADLGYIFGEWSLLRLPSKTWVLIYPDGSVADLGKRASFDDAERLMAVESNRVTWDKDTGPSDLWMVKS